MLISLDIETECIYKCPTNCRHALYPHTANITCVGVWSPETGGLVFRDLEKLKEFLISCGPDLGLVGHNLKFDIKHLAHKGVRLRRDRYQYDTQLMASCVLDKIPEDWLEAYDHRRLGTNKRLRKECKDLEISYKGHRRVDPKRGGLSLKVQAPYYLGVEEFWETPYSHDNDEYVLKDCAYTYGLYEQHRRTLIEEGTWDFFKNKLMVWNRMLLDSEMRGIKLDLDLLEKEQELTAAKAAEVKMQLDHLWAPAYKEWRENKAKPLLEEHALKLHKALAKLKRPEKSKSKNLTKALEIDRARTEKFNQKLKDMKSRYEESLKNKVERIPHTMNLSSPSQLLWLLREHKGYDVSTFDGEESTGKAVLQELAFSGKEDIKLFLKYRSLDKLATAFFPSYKEKQVGGILHCNFNAAGTRTGRLSSNDPNLQQVPGGLHKLFIPRQGYKFITMDESAIEPRIIAYYTECPILFSILEGGHDFHGYNTCIFFELSCNPNQIKELYPKERSLAKEIGLALFYGAGAQRIMEAAHKKGFMWSLEECQSKLAAFRDAYKAVFDYRNKLNKQLRFKPLTTLYGRKIKIKTDDIYMTGLNTLVQSTASDLLLEAAEKISRNYQVLLYVHDEIVVEVPADNATEAYDNIEKIMTEKDLTNSLGRINLKVEGNISSHWSK